METLPRRQWNLNPPKINSRNLRPIFNYFFSFSFSPGFLYQNSKASRWIYWNPELNRDLVPAVAGQNHNYFKTGKEKNKTSHSVSVPLCCRSLYLEILTLTSENLLIFAKSCSLTALSVQMCAPAICHAASQPPKCSCEHHCHPAVQSSQDQPQPQVLGSPPEQINIDSLSPSLSDIIICSGGRKCFLLRPGFWECYIVS